MREIKILFMGTPEFAVPMLDAIHKSKYELVGIVTAPDKPSGRGRKINTSAVKQYAVKKDIKILQPINLKSDEFQKDLELLNPNLIVVVAFRMLPERVWKFPVFGTFNLHASLLPQYRGAAPINWAIINGENKTGLSTFFIDEKIDTGEIIDQIELPIEENDNLEDVYVKMLPKGTELVMQTISSIEKDSLKTKKQSEQQELKMAPKLTKQNTLIDWSRKGKEIYNLVRGLSPYPLAWCLLQNGKEKIICKVSDVNYELKTHHLDYGSIIFNKDSLKVAVKDGFVNILKIKLAGKRMLNVKDLLNGYEFLRTSMMISPDKDSI